MKSYAKALVDFGKKGLSKAEPSDVLAASARALCLIHTGCNPKLIYEGATKKGLTGKQLIELAGKDCAAFGDLMFL